MNKIEQVSKILADHMEMTEGEHKPSDKEVLTKVQELVSDYLESNKVKAGDCCEAPPRNVYQVKMSTMTPQELALLGVRLISVNNESLYWVTSVGQLYKFEDKESAFEAEYLWLMSDVK